MDVAWVLAKYIDNNNMVFGLIGLNGDLQLIVIKNGQVDYTSVPSSYSPTVNHTIDISVVGRYARMWVDGELTNTLGPNDWLDDFSGSAGFHNHNQSQAIVSSITVMDE